MPEGESAAVVAYDKISALLILIEGPVSSPTSITAIAGEADEAAERIGKITDRDYAHEVVLTGIDVAAIRKALVMRSVKHASFRTKESSFSLIAHLIQKGYQGILQGAVEPQERGVGERWSAEDLGRYSKKWIASFRTGKQGASGTRDADAAKLKDLIRSSRTFENARTIFQLYRGDLAVVTMDEAQRRAELKRLEKGKLKTGRLEKIASGLGA